MCSKEVKQGKQCRGSSSKRAVVYVPVEGHVLAGVKPRGYRAGDLHELISRETIMGVAACTKRIKRKAFTETGIRIGVGWCHGVSSPEDVRQCRPIGQPGCGEGPSRRHPTVELSQRVGWYRDQTPLAA